MVPWFFVPRASEDGAAASRSGAGAAETGEVGATDAAAARNMEKEKNFEFEFPTTPISTGDGL
jgi:hypothetical protein